MRRRAAVWVVVLVLVLLAAGGWAWLQWNVRKVDPPRGFAHGDKEQASKLAEAAGVLRADEPTGALEVVLKDGPADTFAIVTLRRLTAPIGVSVSRYARDGRATFSRLPLGEYELRARSGTAAGAVASVAIAAGQNANVELVLDKPEPDPLPAAYYAAAIEFPSQAVREDFRLHCSFCHQIGNPFTRRARPPEDWSAVLKRMQGMGAVPTQQTIDALPAMLSQGLTGAPKPGLPPPPGPAGTALDATIEEWPMGNPISFVHDLAVGPQQWVAGVDMGTDLVLTLDRATGERREWRLPDRGNPRGGYLRAAIRPVGTLNAAQGPHSVEWGADGRLWTTNSLSNELMSLDPKTGATQHWSLPRGGFYPHTLRVREHDVWFTVALSGHLGHLDLRSGEVELIALPRENWEQQVGLSLLGYAFGRSSSRPGTDAHLDLSLSKLTGNGSRFMPLPYGIDLNPLDGSVWYSKLYSDRIGRYDPKTRAIREWPTPFRGPRRIAFDSKGVLWIPGFVSGNLARFDPATEKFETFPIPAVPEGAELPYAVAVHPKDDQVWVGGTAMDAIYRFDPSTRSFQVYPLPLRGAFIRELEFDPQGRVCASYGHLPREHLADKEQGLVCVTP